MPGAAIAPLIARARDSRHTSLHLSAIAACDMVTGSFVRLESRRLKRQDGCYASMPRWTRIRSALSFQTSILVIWPFRTTKRST
ncbi:hypothetical protein ABIB80_003159 [Bradyrhizobium sp. i1.15.2]